MSSDDVFGKFYLYGYTDKVCGKVAVPLIEAMAWDQQGGIRLQPGRGPYSHHIFIVRNAAFLAKAGPTTVSLEQSLWAACP
ncbi:hypothetical protein [Pseudomonas viridiflava]|uniref:hypothetical protein n=1 Tax=Pseudomonas viridiflava TaxID=33069 RepID=UPI0013C3532B|nr:hypothetical protein [Pseudomonas viridiflava]